MILDSCQKLKKINNGIEKDHDFEDTVTVNLDSHPQLESI